MGSANKELSHWHDQELYLEYCSQYQRNHWIK